MADVVSTVVSSTLNFRRMHPGGGPLGRCSYGIPGVPGIVVFDVALFANGQPPSAITVNIELATPKPRTAVAAVTSAVVAAANAAQAAVKSEPIATPAEVAATVASGATILVTGTRPASAKPNLIKSPKAHSAKVG